MSLNNKLKIAVIGATGYTGLDLIYILSKHPKVKILNLCATKSIGKKISFFDRRIKKNLPKISLVNKVNWDDIDLVFLSMPNGEAQKLIKKTFFKYKNLKYIDLSADFRLTNPQIYLKNYKINHKAKDLIKHALYSISELSRKKIHKYRIVANPGCYPTSIQLPLIPLIQSQHTYLFIFNLSQENLSIFSNLSSSLVLIQIKGVLDLISNSKFLHQEFIT